MMKVQSAFYRAVLTVFAITMANTAVARESASKIHIPWPLFETELKSVIEKGAAPWRSTLPDTTMSVAGWHWNLSGIRVDTQASMGTPVMNESQLFMRASKLNVRLGLDRISVDQVIEQNVSGAIIRIRLKASCGPIRLIQEQAQAEVSFSMDWSTGAPTVRLSNLNLAWPPGSWTVAEFACEGPQGLDVMLRDEIVNRMKEPTEIKPMISNWLASELQTRMRDSLQSLKTPFSFPTQDAQLPMRIGRMSASTSGLLVDFIFGDATATPPLAATPSAQILSTLPKDSPVMLGSFDVLDHLVQNELSSRGSVSTVDLRTFSSFKSLLNSRFLQFFVWPDLFNYSKDSPFFLRFKMPTSLKLTKVDESHLSTAIPLQAVVQSKRDGKWWDYISIKGKTAANIAVDVSEGHLMIQTSLDQPQVAIGYGDDYQKNYGSSGWLPISSIRDGLTGPQSMLSGNHAMPDINLGLVGRFRSSGFNWTDPQTFAITWRKVP